MSEPKQLQEYAPGDVALLCECGGEGVVKILNRNQERQSDGFWLGFKVQFIEIWRQYPYVPYNPGDVIEIGVKLERDGTYGGQGGWDFEELRKREVCESS